jgi:hypothetical protein
MRKKVKDSDTTYEYLVVDDDLSEEFGTLYQGPDEAEAKTVAGRWHSRESVKLKRRKVSPYEELPKVPNPHPFGGLR